MIIAAPFHLSFECLSASSFTSSFLSKFLSFSWAWSLLRWSHFCRQKAEKWTKVEPVGWRLGRHLATVAPHFRGFSLLRLHDNDILFLEMFYKKTSFNCFAHFAGCRSVEFHLMSIDWPLYLNRPVGRLIFILKSIFTVRHLLQFANISTTRRRLQPTNRMICKFI